MDISVIVPLYNEAESLPELTAWIERVMEENKFSYEIWFINDGSTDDSWQVIESLREKNSRVKGVKFRRNYGKSPALYTGFQRAEGDVVITMDADLQDSPDEIPELYRMIAVEGYDLVSGWKKKRYDPLSKTIPTKLFNATARKVSGIKNLHDFNCGLKASLEYAAYDAHRVLFTARRGQRRIAGGAARHLGADEFHVQGKPGGNALQNNAYGRAVGFAEQAVSHDFIPFFRPARADWRATLRASSWSFLFSSPSFHHHWALCRIRSTSPAAARESRLRYWRTMA